MRLIYALKTLILNTLFPPVCTSCKREGDFLCADCSKSLKLRKIKGKKKEKDPDFRYLDGVIYALDYAENPAIQAAIKQLKYKYTQELSETFANLMSLKLSELTMTRGRKILLVPVPLHQKRLNERGFNQAEIIAERIKDSEVIHLLERIKNTKQQARLSKSDRHKNLDGAFRLRKESIFHYDLRREMNKKCTQYSPCAWGPYSDNRGVRKKGEKENNVKEKDERKQAPHLIREKDPIYFLVDDVCTTGSTLEKCAEVLKAHGLKKVYGLVVARAFK